jgi:phage terminase small subunit
MTELPLSNARHEAYAQGLSSGKTSDQAYADAGYKRNRKNATRLKTNKDVVSRVAYLQAQKASIQQDALKAIAQKEVLTRQWVLDNLVKNARMCMGLDPAPSGHQPAGANKALELLGKELGMFIERKEEGKPGEFAELDELTDADLVDIARRSGSRAIEAAFGSSGSTGVH